MAGNTSTKKISSAQRAAAIVITIGADSAAEIYRHLREEEIEQVTLEIAKMERLPPEEMQSILEDFYGLCITQKVISEGGVIYAKDILEKAFGAQTAANYMDRVSKSLRSKAFEFVRKADYKNLMMMVQSEHPQTIALILSYARADQASRIISELPRNMQVDIIERIANLDRASPEVIHIVESILEQKFSSVVSVDLMEIGGVNYVADIMNHVDRGTEKYIFDELGAVDPVLTDEIRNLMFVFEDIVFLDDMAIQRAIREIDSKDLAVALKAANEDVKATILRNMSQRMQETVVGDMEYLHNLRMRDVEEAQQRIVGSIRALEEAGEIVISKGGEDEIIA